MIPTAFARALPAAALLLAVTACTQDSSSPSRSTPRETPTGTASTTISGATPAINIRLTINGDHIAATLNDSATARDFAAQLPLTLSLRDFNQAEKIADLPRELSTTGAPEGADPQVGDIAYYEPWGTLATYYGEAPYYDGVIPIGHMADEGPELLADADEVTIEAAS
ncbi:cyclophilin-like fold protein [Streptomyces sp. NBC_01231]|nr:cyclophilin-like fold protein [Streptomyces sp. NBC_01231]